MLGLNYQWVSFLVYFFSLFSEHFCSLADIFFENFKFIIHILFLFFCFRMISFKLRQFFFNAYRFTNCLFLALFQLKDCIFEFLNFGQFLLPLILDHNIILLKGLKLNLAIIHLLLNLCDLRVYILNIGNQLLIFHKFPSLFFSDLLQLLLQRVDLLNSFIVLAYAVAQFNEVEHVCQEHVVSFFSDVGDCYVSISF